MTVGLIGLDYTTLEVLSKSGTPKEQAAAKKILPIVNNHHLLLVTLLLATSSAEEAMPLFLERMMPFWASIIVSVILVLIFAEVIPMALCTRYGLDIGAKMAWVVHVMIVIAYPVAFPISKVLDWLFGHSAGTLFKRSQLKELINMHSKHSIQTAADVEAELRKLPVEERLTSHEVQLIKNALDLNARLAIEISTAIDDVYMLDYDQICDGDVIGSIVHYGLHFSVPVYKENRDNIVGVISVGDLIKLSPEDNKPISELGLDPILKISSDTPVYHALTKLQAAKAQIALLVDPQLTRIPVAVLTIDDIIEELVEGQISDLAVFPAPKETDENILGEWLAGDDDTINNEGGNGDDDDPLHLEVASTASAFSTASMPTRARPYFPFGSSSITDMSLDDRKIVQLDYDDAGDRGNGSGSGREGRGRASSFSSNVTVPLEGVPSSAPANAASSATASAYFSQRLPAASLVAQKQMEMRNLATPQGNQAHSRSLELHDLEQAAFAEDTAAAAATSSLHSPHLMHVGVGGSKNSGRNQASSSASPTKLYSPNGQYSDSNGPVSSSSANTHLPVGTPPRRTSLGYRMSPSSSSASLPIRQTTKLIPVSAHNPDYETSSTGSEYYRGDRFGSSSSVTSDYSGARSQPTDDHTSQAGSDASGYSASTAPAHLNTSGTPLRRRKPKDPNVAHTVDKKLNVASIVATALKRSSSSLSATPAPLMPLPVIYRRNVQGEAVVDPSKLLSASYGDLPHPLGTPVEEDHLPPIRTLSASHDDVPDPDEEHVVLDW